MARKSSIATSGNQAQTLDLEGAVVRSLALLTEGHTSEFCQFADPPCNISDWLNNAEIEPIRGLLISSLRRWHELQQLAQHPSHRASHRVSRD